MCGQKISKKNFWEKIPPVMGYPEIIYSNPENFRLNGEKKFWDFFW
jgi:hypothetical protein